MKNEDDATGGRDQHEHEHDDDEGDESARSRRGFLQ
jgi:hypothetical protein